MTIKTPDVKGPDALLVVEVSDTSLNYDLKTKLPLYASHGVREYWVINAATGMTAVHRQPSGNAYAFAQEFPADARGSCRVSCRRLRCPSMLFRREPASNRKTTPDGRAFRRRNPTFDCVSAHSRRQLAAPRTRCREHWRLRLCD
jgi:hypothetical protein